MLTADRSESPGAPSRGICHAVKDIVPSGEDVEVVYPVHLNPNVRTTVFEELDGGKRIHLIDPADYETFVHMMSKCYLILTDSGGIQEEAPVLGKRARVMRDGTERPEAIEAGVARLVRTARESITRHTLALLDDEQDHQRVAKATSPYGDGKASQRIVGEIRARFVSESASTGSDCGSGDTVTGLENRDGEWM